MLCSSENALDLELTPADASRLIPVYLGTHYFAAIQMDVRKSLSFPPPPSTIACFRSLASSLIPDPAAIVSASAMDPTISKSTGNAPLMAQDQHSLSGY